MPKKESSGNTCFRILVVESGGDIYLSSHKNLFSIFVFLLKQGNTTVVCKRSKCARAVHHVAIDL